MANSRIQKSLKNAQVNVAFYVISVILAFFSRKFFLQNLGTEFLGLSGTLGDMLNLMNITELGIGTAVGVTLYKPIFDKNHEMINDIISVFGFLYTRVGCIIAGAGVILSCFFPIMFAKAGVPLYLVYLMFYSMLYSALLGYFVNYKQIILSASQQNYVIMLRYNTAVTLKVILQILTSFLPYNYLWWIGLEAITITVYTFILNGTIRKYFPWLDTSVKRGKEKFREYKNLWTKTKQVFVFKLSHLLFTSTTNILTASFASLSMVAIFGNYNVLYYKVTSLFDGLFTGMSASIGNLISEGDKDKTIKVFYELLSSRYFLAGFCSIVLFFTASPFISVWLGSDYVMPNIIIVLLSIHIFISQARITVTNFKDAFGFFQDIWAPITEVILYLIISVLLGSKYGVAGILIGTLTAEIIIRMIWQPYYLFKHGFEKSVIRYYWPHIIKYSAVLCLCVYIISLLNNRFFFSLFSEDWLSLLIYCAVVSFVVFVILFLLFVVTDKYFIVFIRHLLAYFKNKGE